MNCVSGSEINFESLQRELLETEDYLVRNSRDCFMKGELAISLINCTCRRSANDPVRRRGLEGRPAGATQPRRKCVLL